MRVDCLGLLLSSFTRSALSLENLTEALNVLVT